MLLNGLEFALMNNPLRAALQRRVEARRLLAMAGPMGGGVALEVGCGRGVGLELVLDAFGAQAAHGFDLDGRMVRRARRLLARDAHRVRLWQGDATAIAAPAAAYDAVFDFGILHHVPDWRAAVREIFRVLKPGGRLYAEEVLRRFITHPVARATLRHPQHDRFDAAELATALGAAGFANVRTRSVGQLFAWLVADRPPAR